MKSSLYYIISFITGAVISIMVTFNTEAGRITSSEVSLIVNQIVGIITLEAIMLLARKNEVERLLEMVEGDGAGRVT